ncbi:MAG: cyclic nucleotide-binding domain-containing protein [Gammaproteobacteria bacterium]|nr:cyclic nucleotide-binding domain-containing protein [Gammaproteobacteria bacterium]
MRQNELGRLYQDGDVVVRKGESGDCMFIIQKGLVEVFIGDDNHLVRTMGSGEIFGEMSLFTGESRSATVRAKGEARVLTIDQPAFHKRIQEDPMLAFRILGMLTDRIAALDPNGLSG